MTRTEYAEAMRADDKVIAYGLNPCPKGGHKLRTRSGNCPQCDTSTLSYVLRYYTDARIYIAGSKSRKIIKVGVSKDSSTLSKRIGILNVRAEGGARDWRLLSDIFCGKTAYKLESLVHGDLKNYSCDATYMNSGKLIRCKEIFSCSYYTAKWALLFNINESHREMFHENEEASQYGFD